MRRLLLKVLVIAVFLNAAIGVPLHAAVHLGAGGAAQALSFSAAEPGSHDRGDEHDDRDHAPCAWCLAHTESSSAPPAVLDSWRLSDRHEPPARQETAVPPVFSAGLWSSAPRGPPSF